jgi:curved DNA-binding protein CbpA
MTDPFSILGVDENASDDEIKRRYLALVRAFPPDREPQRFQNYRAAFEALQTERQRLAAKLLNTNGAALARLKTASLPSPAARQQGRVSRAQVTALLVEGIEQAMARWQETSRTEAARAGASRTNGA